jgi:hypothetical protein
MTTPDAGQPPTPLPLSVVTVCKDSMGTIRPVLESVAGIAGEIVAIDSGSTDGTIELLHEFGAVVIERKWEGFVRTKQIALESARLPWVLHLDSDEPVTPELARSIRELIEGDDPEVCGARVRRVVWYRGEPLNHAWQPEWRARLVRTDLVRRGRARWAGIDPHDYLEIDSGSGRVIELGGVLRHDSFQTFDEHLGKQLGHARTAATALHELGRKSSPWKLMTSPIGAFAKQIVAKRAWRDGTAGWLAAGTAAAGTLMKHMILLERGLEKGPETEREQAESGSRAGGREHAPDGKVAYSSSVERRSTGTVERPSDHPGRPPAQEPAGRGATHPGKAPVSDDPRDPSVEESSPQSEPASDAPERGPEDGPAIGPDGEPVKKKRRRRRRRKKKSEEGGGDGGKSDAGVSIDADANDDDGDDVDDGSDDDKAVSKNLRNVTPLSEEAKAHVFNLKKSFRDLGLNDDLVRALDEAGWEHPTKIQAELIPPVLDGRHVLMGRRRRAAARPRRSACRSSTDDGKGRRCRRSSSRRRASSRVQIRDDIDHLGKRTGIKSVAIYGGQKIQTQAMKLEKGPEIIVGTPVASWT